MPLLILTVAKRFTQLLPHVSCFLQTSFSSQVLYGLIANKTQGTVSVSLCVPETSRFPTVSSIVLPKCWWTKNQSSEAIKVSIISIATKAFHIYHTGSLCFGDWLCLDRSDLCALIFHLLRIFAVT